MPKNARPKAIVVWRGDVGGTSRVLFPATAEHCAAWETLSAGQALAAETLPTQGAWLGRRIVLDLGAGHRLAAAVLRDDTGNEARFIARLTDGRVLLAIGDHFTLLASDAPAALALVSGAARARTQLHEVTYQGLRIQLDRPQGTVREVTGPDGAAVTITQRDDYGFFAPERAEEQPMGEDGQPYDAYVGKQPSEPRVRIITQLSAHNGTRRQQKALLGYASDDAAKEAFLAHSHPKMFGRIGSLPIESFKAQMASAVAADAVLIVETDEDAAELDAMALLASEQGLGQGLKTLLGRLDKGTAALTNFPCDGEDLAVSLRNSRYPRCSPDMGEALQRDCLPLWETGGPGTQHAILARVKRTGGVAKTRAEILAVRMRERWAADHCDKSDAATVVAQCMWLVQHTKGEDHMKQVLADAKAALEAEKAKAAGHAPSIDLLAGREPAADVEPASEDPTASDPGSLEEPSAEEPSSVSTSDLTEEARLARAAARLTPQAPVTTDHRSEDAADAGPLSCTPAALASPSASRTPMPPENAHAAHRSLDALFQRVAAAALLTPLLDPELAAGGPAERAAGAGVQGRATPAAGAPAAVAAAVPGSAAPGIDTPRQLTVQVKEGSIDEANREVWWVASTATVDSYGEIVDQKEWDFTRFKTNPVILFCHQSWSLPIGRAVDWKVEADQLLIKIRFSKANPLAVTIWEMILEDMIRAGSVGFMPGEVTTIEVNGKQRVVLKKNKLYEFSICSIPANPDAVMLSAMEERLVRALDACEQRLKSLSFQGGPSAPPPAVPSTQPRAAAAPARASSQGVPDMKIFTLDSKAQNTLRDVGHILLTCSDCNVEHRIEAPQLGKALADATAAVTAATERAGAAEAAKTTALTERDAALRLANENLTALTKLELSPLVGLEVYQLSPAEAEGLTTIRSASPEQYSKLLAAAQDRYTKGSTAAKAEAERKAKEAGTGSTGASATTEGTAAERTPPTHAADARPAAEPGATKSSDASTLLGRLTKAADAPPAPTPAS